MSRAAARKLLVPTLFILVAIAVVAAPAEAQPAAVNVLQDCWTTDLDADSDREKELYTYTTDDAVTFVWKHKIMETCTSYVATIAGKQCRDGKPRLLGSPYPFIFANIPYGPVSPDPLQPELIFTFTAPPGSIPVGRHDWAVVVECDDSGDGTKKDEDLDDTCGVNMGLVLGGPLVFGPEPVELWNPDPGGAPAGRGPGEEGTTRPWCFEVEPALATCDPGSCTTGFTNCGPGPGFCGCAELADMPGTGVCLSSFSCSNTACPGGDADCPAGQVCTTNTCCTGNVCAPPICNDIPLSGGMPGPSSFGNIF